MPLSPRTGPVEIEVAGAAAVEVPAAVAGRPPARPSDPGASDELFALVYEELRRLAHRFLSKEAAGQTLQSTALVHEAYLRLAGGSEDRWESRAHFFGAAARAIRCILVDRSRARGARRAGALEPAGVVAAPRIEDLGDSGRGEPCPDLLDLDQALGRLARLDPEKARVVELRFFGGLTTEETAEALGTSPSTVARQWRFARIWLHRELAGGDAR